MDKNLDYDKKALVIFSGGQDSTTCLYWALNKYKEVEAISFIYGQKHNIEIEQSKKILEKAGVKQTIVDLGTSLKILAESALTSNGDVSQKNKYGMSSSFVPGRNGIFLYNAYIYALKTNADVLVTGICQANVNVYPDCTRDYVDKLLEVMNIGVFATKESNIKIETPIVYLTKSEVFKLAENENCLNVVIEMSHTCYNGSRLYKHNWGWSSEKGTYDDPLCSACKLRENGWIEYINK